MNSVFEGEGHRAELEHGIRALLAKYGDKVVTQPLPVELESARTHQTVLKYPGKIIALGNDRLAIADSGHNRILITDLQGTTEETIGSGDRALRDGDFTHAAFSGPQGMAYADGRLYIADTFNHALRVADIRMHTVTTIAGTGVQGEARENLERADALKTRLSSPWDVAFYPDAAHLVIAMAGVHQLWQYELSTRTVSLVAGNGREAIADGKLPDNSFAQSSGLAVLNNKLYITDPESSALRVMTSDGEVATLIGQGLFDFGYKEGNATTARMQHCLGLAAENSAVFIADTYNHSIRRYDIPTQQLRNYAGHNARGVKDGPISTASFNEPGGITALGRKLYVADTNNNLIRVIDEASGSVSTLEVRPGSSPPKS